MTTYVYETIPRTADEVPERFEVQQSMKEAPLTFHPDSGRPVRRVILGGYGVLLARPAAESRRPCEETGVCCGREGCCHEGT